MPLVSEFLNGGIVTVRDPSLLREGELQQAAECVYRAHDPALYRAPGRTVYNTTTIKDSSGATCPVKGLVWLPFGQTRTDQFLALGGNDNSKGALWGGNFSAVDGTATFAQITGPGQVTDAVTTSSSAVITSASGGFAYMVQGAAISGTNIPAGSIVITVTSATSITISNNCTGNGTVTATFDMGIAATVSDSGDEILDSVQWGGLYFTFFGHGPMQRVNFTQRSIPGTSLSDLLVARVAGLDPVGVQPTVAVNTGAGHSWSSVLGTGYYWLLTVEVFHPDQPDEVEGTYTPKDDKGNHLGPVPFRITDYTTQDVTVTRTTQVNDGSAGRLATHWRVYLSPKQDDNVTVPSLATFRLVATVPMSSTTCTLADAVVSRTGYATAVTSWAGRNQFATPGGMIGASDNGFAVSTSGSSTDGPGNGSNANGINKLTSFAFSGSDGTYSGLTVTGIRVSIRGFADPSGNAGREAGYYIYVSNAAQRMAQIWGKFTSKNASWNGYGSNFDTMGVPWIAADFASGGGFFVLVEKQGTGSRQRLWVDTVQVVVYYSGTSINMNGKAFRVVTYRDQVGNTLNVPARLPPPECSTADLFQGSLVTNDLGNEDQIKFSLPGEPEAFPDPYVLKFNERRHNKVNYIRRVGQILIVGLSDAVKRVNYLPSEQDTSFQEGLAHEDLASDHGIVGPLAGCLFTMPGAGQMLAYVAENGLHATDGVTTRFLNIDLKWSALVEPGYLNKVVLRDYPAEQWLVMYYTPLGGTKNTRALVFCYSMDKIKEGGFFPAIGPVSVAARCAAKAKLANKYYLFTGAHSGGLIYTEDSGYTIPANYSDGDATVTGAPRVRTRQFYPSGIDRNTREERIYLHFGATGSLVATNTCTFTKGSPTVTMADTTGLVKGMLVVTGNVAGDTIILSVDNGTTITISTNANESGSFSTGFDNSTLAITVYRENIGEGSTACETAYVSMRLGSLAVAHPDNQGQALELQFDKVIMPDASRVDAGVDMRLNYFAYDVADAGKEQNRAGS